MKDKIIFLIIGVLLGAIITSTGLLIYNKSIKSDNPNQSETSQETNLNEKMGTPPNSNMGEPPAKPSGDDSEQPPEKPDGNNNEEPPTKPEENANSKS